LDCFIAIKGSRDFTGSGKIEEGEEKFRSRDVSEEVV